MIIRILDAIDFFFCCLSQFLILPSQKLYQTVCTVYFILDIWSQGILISVTLNKTDSNLARLRPFIKLISSRLEVIHW